MSEEGWPLLAGPLGPPRSRFALDVEDLDGARALLAAASMEASLEWVLHPWYACACLTGLPGVDEG